MKHLQESFCRRAGWLALLLSVAAWCLISGCDALNGLDNPVAPGSVGVPGNIGANQVWIMNSIFSPGSITVPRYTKITWTNKDVINQTVTSVDGLFDSGTLTTNETFECTFNDRGTFTYRSIYKPNMYGTVIVE